MVVADLSAPVLDGSDARHLDAVLRLRPGEAVSATDGKGGWRLCTYTGRGAIEPAGDVERRPARSPRLTVAFVPVKGDRPDWAVQKLAELGVDRILLARSARSVVRWEGERADSHLERLRRVARSAIMQSRQVWLPDIDGIIDAADLLGPPLGGVGVAGGVVGPPPGGVGVAGGVVGPPPGGVGVAGGVVGPPLGGVGVAGGVVGPPPGGVGVADMGGRPPWSGLHTVVIGPEGGWTGAERELAGDSVVGLGSTVLRAETAAVAAGGLLCALRDGLVRPAADG